MSRLADEPGARARSRRRAGGRLRPLLARDARALVAARDRRRRRARSSACSSRSAAASSSRRRREVYLGQPLSRAGAGLEPADEPRARAATSHSPRRDPAGRGAVPACRRGKLRGEVSLEADPRPDRQEDRPASSARRGHRDRRRAPARRACARERARRDVIAQLSAVSSTKIKNIQARLDARTAKIKAINRRLDGCPEAAGELLAATDRPRPRSSLANSSSRSSSTLLERAARLQERRTSAQQLIALAQGIEQPRMLVAGLSREQVDRRAAALGVVIGGLDRPRRSACSRRSLGRRWPRPGAARR